MMTQIFTSPMARKTSAMGFEVVGVSGIVGMSLMRAVRLLALVLTTKTSALILGIRDYLKMARVYTMANTAQVVKLHPNRDRANKPLIAKAMSLFDYSCGNFEMPIAITNTANPQPAGIRFLYLRPEANLWRNLSVFIWHRNNKYNTSIEGVKEGVS